MPRRRRAPVRWGYFGLRRDARPALNLLVRKRGNAAVLAIEQSE